MLTTGNASLPSQDATHGQRPVYKGRARHRALDMTGFALGVEDELGVMTQVATPGGLKLRIRERVLREAVAL